VPFAYFKRLNKAQQRIYHRSDSIRSIHLPETRLDSLLEALEHNLQRDRPRQVETVCQRILDRLTAALNVAAVRVEIYATRPHGRWGELHGLYTPAEKRELARIEVWMRTAQRRQIVAFRTFLRTLLHELCHHLDYELLKLTESFHTEGFYQRESSLLNQLALQNHTIV